MEKEGEHEYTIIGMHVIIWTKNRIDYQDEMQSLDDLKYKIWKGYIQWKALL